MSDRLGHDDVLKMNEGRVVSRDDLADLAAARWPQWRKTVPVSAIRVDGPFRVMTSESENEPFFCEDGYLAVDARGYPYAIAADEFALIYEEAPA